MLKKIKAFSRDLKIFNISTPYFSELNEEDMSVV